MPLLAFNLTGTALALAAGKPVPPVLPASVSPPARGQAYDVTSELRPNLTVDPAHGKSGGLTNANYISIQAQVTAASIALEWTGDPEYLTTGLSIPGPAPGAHAATHKTAGGTDVLAIASTTAVNSAAATGIAGTGAGTSHNHGVTDAGHDHGAATGAGASHTHSVASATPAITADKIRQQQYLGAVDSPGDNYVAQYAGGSAIDDAVGPFTQFVPPRTVQIARGGAGVATVYTIDGTDCDGAALQEIINSNGAVTVQGTRAFATITRVRSDVDPTVTTDVQTGAGFGLGVAASDIDMVGVDGVKESPTSSHAATGTVIPASPPNATRLYTAQYRVLPTAAQAAHDHGAATGAEAAHTHAVSSGTTGVTVDAEAAHTHGITDPTHNHTQSGHAHNIT